MYKSVYLRMRCALNVVNVLSVQAVSRKVPVRAAAVALCAQKLVSVREYFRRRSEVDGVIRSLLDQACLLPTGRKLQWACARNTIFA